MNRIAKKILDHIKYNYINKDDLVADSYPPNSGHLLNDFDDYIPFLMYYGEHELVEKQITIASSKTICGMIPIDNRIVTWRQDEWLGAIWDYRKVNKTPHTNKILDESLKFMQERLIIDGFVNAFYNLKFKTGPRMFDPRTGALLESLLYMGDEISIASDIAFQCLDKLINWSTTHRQYLMPNIVFYENDIKNKISRLNPIKIPGRFIYPYVPGWRSLLGDLLVYIPFQSQVKLAKQNSNLIHAYISAYEMTNDMTYMYFIDNWFRDFENYMYDNGSCFSILTQNKNVSDVKLSHNHPIIEICLDLFLLTDRRRFLEMGTQIIHHWMSRRFSNGLFPAYENSDWAFLDDQTDLIINLVKLWKISDESKYLDIAQQLFKDVIDHFMTEQGLISYVSLNKKESAKPIIEPKYNSLFLKACIALDDPNHILDEDMRLLLKDR